MTPTVLVVDSDPDEAAATARALESEGYETVVADSESSTEADDDEPVLPERVDCVVTDVDVRGREGLAFADAVRSRWTDVSVIVYTAQGSEAVASRAISIGVDEYVRKSRGPEALRTALNRTVGSKGVNGRESESKSENGVGLEDESANSAVIVSDRDSTEVSDHKQEVKRYRTIIETVGDMIYALDADGRLTLADQTLAGYVGVERSTLLGMHVEEVLTEEAYEMGAQLVRTLLETEMTDRGRYEFEIERSDGEVRTLENNLTVMTDGDSLQGSVGVIRDVTERRTQTRALKRQNEHLDEFVSIVSHDLRNPLAVIDGTARQIAETGEIAGLETITECTKRMDSMLSELLTLARDGQDVGQIERVCLERVVFDAWRHVETDDSTLVFDELGTIDADRARLRQLLENLFRNAVEHSSDPAISLESQSVRGERSHSTAQTHSQPPTDENRAGLTVTVERIEGGFAVVDDGPGIDPQDCDAVFDRGFTTRTEGTGFGLSIVQRIAEAHDWSITLDEAYTDGARFVVRTDPDAADRTTGVSQDVHSKE